MKGFALMQSRSYPNAYQKNQIQQGNPRENEARALTEAARRLHEGLTKNEARVIYDGLQFNLRLWTIFQTDLATDENPLPLDLKKTVLELCRYIDKSTFKYYATRDKSIIESFIEINRTIASGMMEKPLSNPEVQSAQQARETQMLSQMSV